MSPRLRGRSYFGGAKARENAGGEAAPLTILNFSLPTAGRFGGLDLSVRGTQNCSL